MVDHDEPIGIDQTVTELVEAIVRPSKNWVVSVFGAGGIGKTTIAYEVARACSAHGMFNKIAWASAVNAESADPNVEIYWIDLIESLATQLSMSLGQRALHYRRFRSTLESMPDDEQYLIVIDNLERIADAKNAVGQLKELGVLKRHKVMLTTRESILKSSNLVSQVTVKRMRDDDAVRLVRHLGRNDEDLARVGRAELKPVLAVGDGNPYFIKLVVKQYLSTYRPLDIVLRELTDLQNEEGQALRNHLFARSITSLEAQFGDWALDLLNAFCTKDAGGTFTRDELQSITGIADGRTFDELLGSACSLGLATASELNRRYAIHSLLHEFTRQETV